MKAVVYGSGVSGLIAAYGLFKKGVEVTLVDPFHASILQSLNTDDGVVELAANSILYNREVGELLKDIDLDYDFYSPLGKKKFVVLGKKIKRWPLGPIETLKSAKILFKLARKNKELEPKEQEMLGDWGKRVLNEPILEKLLKPALQGIYGFETEKLSASLVFKNFFTRGKITESKNFKTPKGSISFKNGMQDFTKSLRAYLEKNGVEFVIEPKGKFDFSIVSTPTHSLPDCVSSKNKGLLSRVQYKPMSTATFIVKEKERLKIEGFGSVFKDGPEGVLGLILNSDLFEGRANRGQVSETWIADGREVITQYEMEKAVEKIKKNVFKKEIKPERVYFKHWPQAFPTYSIELEKTLGSLEQKQDKVFFFANWTGQLGIGSMIKEHKNFVEGVLKECQGV